MSEDRYCFWRAQLAGESPETTPGCPWAGYYIAERYVSLPFAIPARKGGSVHRVKVQAPVAIWFREAFTDWEGVDEAPTWIAQINMPNRTQTIFRTEDVDDLFGQVCRSPITYERYNEMLNEICKWKAGYERAPITD